MKRQSKPYSWIQMYCNLSIDSGLLQSEVLNLFLFLDAQKLGKYFFLAFTALILSELSLLKYIAGCLKWFSIS